ncbi:MAG: signal recognition particle protein [Firmicutes bacterium]|nr:signal recognition particle protein [Bacillota bacterium]
MFPALSEKLQSALRNLRSKGKLTEKDVTAALREVRLALLDADVNYKVVKDFINKVKERSIGEEVMKSLTPGQQVVKIVNEEMTQLMGGFNDKLKISSKLPTVVMLVGLQGSGKTTTAVKLAKYLQKNGHTPLIAACDIYRPAAIKQLEVLGRENELPIFSMGEQEPVNIAKGALKEARKKGADFLLLDTAGRLHVDEQLMEELANIKRHIQPTEILLVVDAMTGQDAVNVAESFHQQLTLTGVILTKLDGDSRGGAALSVKAVTGCPIKFVGLGEKVTAFEPFHPDRMASRILGMGDILSLIEKAEASLDKEKGRELEKKLRNEQFTFEDFLDQLQQIKKIGPLEQIMEMLPGVGGVSKQLKKLSVDEKQLVHVEAIINSMTKEERLKPEIINSSRRKRIARGSGTSVQNVNQLLKQFGQMKKMFKQMSRNKGKFLRGRRGFFP